MDPVVRVSLHSQDSSVVDSISAKFLALPHKLSDHTQIPGGPGLRLTWPLTRNLWAARTPLLSELATLESIRIIETWAPAFSPDDMHDAQLLLLQPPAVGSLDPGAEAPGGLLNCVGCGKQTYSLQASPEIHLTSPTPAKPGVLFSPKGSPVLIGDAELVAELGSAGLRGGLRTLPVTIGGVPSTKWVGLAADEVLPWPAAPYGHNEGPCPGCGRSIPRFRFYPIYPRPHSGAVWMGTPYGGHTRLLVTGEVYRFLRERGYGQERPQALKRGWFPDEQNSAFLPPEFQGPP